MSVDEKMTAITNPIREFMNESGKLTLDAIADRAEQVVEANENLEKVLYGTDFGGKSYYDEFWDSLQQKGERTHYMNCFGGGGWNKDTFKPKYPIVPASTNGARHMFYCFGVNETEPFDFRTVKHLIDFSQVTQAVYTFYSAKINHIEADFSNCTTLQGAFSCEWNATGRSHITLKVSEKCTNFSGCFSYNSELTHLFFVEGSTIAASLSLSYSSLLTHDSLMSTINALKDYSGTTETRTLTLHEKAKERLDESDIAIAQQKGWTIA